MYCLPYSTVAYYSLPCRQLPPGVLPTVLPYRAPDIAAYLMCSRPHYLAHRTAYRVSALGRAIHWSHQQQYCLLLPPKAVQPAVQACDTGSYTRCT